MRWQEIERALSEALAAAGVLIADNGHGAKHFLVARTQRKIPSGPKSEGGFPTTCSLCQQTGEACDFDHERVDLETLARNIEDILR